MEGAATVMAFSAPDPSTRPYPGARHASRPPDWPSDDPGGPAARRQPPPEPSDVPAWWRGTSAAGGGYGSSVGGSYRPSPASGGGYAAPPSPDRYVPPHQPFDQPTRAGGAWYQGQEGQQNTHLPLDQPAPFELALPDLRYQVVSGLIRLNWNHASEAWQRRRRDPLSPHVLVFFFAEPPVGLPPRCELRTAARLFLAADGQRLAVLLYEMARVARDHLAAGHDPRTHIFSWHDEMSAHARYLGLGVSSLDTPAGTWNEVQRSADSDLDLPGRCYARLVDGSTLLLDRLARNEFGASNVWTTHPTYDVSGMRQRRWDFDRDLAESGDYDPDFRATWHWLIQLHNVFLAR